MEKSLIQKGGMIEKVGSEFTKLKTKSKKITDEIENIISKSTAKEKKLLDEAEKKYNEKLQKVLNHPKVKDKLESRWECTEDMRDLMGKISRAYRRAVSEINRQNINDDEKLKRTQSLSDAIENALLTSDEKKIMAAIKNQISLLPYNKLSIQM